MIIKKSKIKEGKKKSFSVDTNLIIKKKNHSKKRGKIWYELIPSVQ